MKILVAFIILTGLAMAQCEGTAPTFSCYLDPDVASGTHVGTQANPWQTVNWTSINTLLATGNVTVYFSAANAAHNANQAYSTGINIARTNTGTNVITFDGISKYNTNDTTPSWATNSAPQLCVEGTTSCTWGTDFKAAITAGAPFGSNATVTNCMGYIAILGFKLVATSSQPINGTYLSNITFQNIEYSASGSTVGPGAIVGPANQGPGKGGVGCAAQPAGGPDNVTFQYNWGHNTFGEGLYIGASTPDPMPSQATQDPGLGNCLPNCHTGANYVIKGNRIESPATVGGQGDCIDIKDGHVNLQVTNNVLRCTLGGVGGGDGQGIAVESGSLIDSNYIEGPGHDGIAVFAGWNTAPGRGVIRISNNIIVNVTSGIGHNSPIDFQSPLTGVTNIWASGSSIYNNSAYLSNDQCYQIESGIGPSGFITIENNIGQGCTGGNVTGGTLIATHDYNDFFTSGTCPGETHGLCVDPKYVSTATPYADVNFKLQGTSLALGAGTNLSTSFTDDYFGNSRVVPFSIGAYQPSNAPPAPSPALFASGQVVITGQGVNP